MKEKIKRLRKKGVVITLQRLAVLHYLEDKLSYTIWKTIKPIPP